MKEFVQILKDTRKHLMTGVSYMIPVIVGGGVLMALSMVFNGGQAAVPESGFAGGMWTIGLAALGMMVPILSMFIAFSIADRPGLAPGLCAGVLASNIGAGFLGGIIGGILAGIIAFYLKKIKLPSSIRTLGPIFIIPLVGCFAAGAIMYWVIGAPVAAIMTWITELLTGLSQGSMIVLGIICGLMIAFDMGGPVNKMCYTFIVATMSQGLYALAGVLAVAVCAPDFGMALATFLAPKKYTQMERDAAKAALAMGCVGITEGAIPFAANDPLRVIPSLMVGSGVGGALAVLFGVTNQAAWGGLIVLPVVSNILGFLIALVAATLVTALMVNLLKKEVVEKTEEEKASEEVTLKFE